MILDPPPLRRVLVQLGGLTLSGALRRRTKLERAADPAVSHVLTVIAMGRAAPGSLVDLLDPEARNAIGRFTVLWSRDPDAGHSAHQNRVIEHALKMVGDEP